MRHLNVGRKLGRTSSQRRALFRNASCSLFAVGLIKTTLAKAKELRRIAEPLITLAKVDTIAHRRLCFNRLRNKVITTKLFCELGPHYRARPGGYLRILKCGYRQGDKAPMAMVELVDRKVS